MRKVYIVVAGEYFLAMFLEENDAKRYCEMNTAPNTQSLSYFGVARGFAPKVINALMP